MGFQNEMKQIFLRVAAGEVFILLLQRTVIRSMH